MVSEAESEVKVVSFWHLHAAATAAAVHIEKEGFANGCSFNAFDDEKFNPLPFSLPASLSAYGLRHVIICSHKWKTTTQTSTHTHILRRTRSVLQEKRSIRTQTNRNRNRSEDVFLHFTLFLFVFFPRMLLFPFYVRVPFV